MYLLNDSGGWDTSRRVVRLTASTLKASDDHAALAKPLMALLTRWLTLDQERRTADDSLVDANARVTWLDAALDHAVTIFVAQLLADGGGNRAHRTFASAVEGATLPKPTAALWKGVTAGFPAGKAALKEREGAALEVARVALRVQRWKDDANATRRSIDLALGKYAVERDLPRDYADTFFPRRQTSKTSAKKPAVEPTP